MTAATADSDSYDVIVLGAGPAGENAAQYAIAGSDRTAVLVEHELVGIHEGGVLHDAAHRTRVEALHEKRAEPADQQDRLSHHPPRHGLRPEQSVVFHV